MTENDKRVTVTDDEVLFVAKAMDIERRIDFDSPDHNYIVAKTNMMHTARLYLVAYRACAQLGAMGRPSKIVEKPGETRVLQADGTTKVTRADGTVEVLNGDGTINEEWRSGQPGYETPLRTPTPTETRFAA